VTLTVGLVFTVIAIAIADESYNFYGVFSCVARLTACTASTVTISMCGYCIDLVEVLSATALPGVLHF
jgi:hypothetical protein